MTLTGISLLITEHCAAVNTHLQEEEGTALFRLSLSYPYIAGRSKLVQTKAANYGEAYWWDGAVPLPLTKAVNSFLITCWYLRIV